MNQSYRSARKRKHLNVNMHEVFSFMAKKTITTKCQTTNGLLLFGGKIMNEWKFIGASMYVQQ